VSVSEDVSTGEKDEDRSLLLAPVRLDNRKIEGRNVVAWFLQNSLLRLKQGNLAEVTFDSIPGKVFAGLVRTVTPASDGG
jgi:hypothetical protein